MDQCDEQMRIMRDVEESKKQAFFDNDEERLRNLRAINTNY